MARGRTCFVLWTDAFLCVAFLCVLQAEKSASCRSAERAASSHSVSERLSRATSCQKQRGVLRYPPACTLALLKLICRLRLWRGEDGDSAFLCERKWDCHGVALRPYMHHLLPKSVISSPNVHSVSQTQPETEEGGVVVVVTPYSAAP